MLNRTVVRFRPIINPFESTQAKRQPVLGLNLLKSTVEQLDGFSARPIKWKALVMEWGKIHEGGQGI